MGDVGKACGERMKGSAGKKAKLPEKGHQSLLVDPLAQSSALPLKVADWL